MSLARRLKAIPDQAQMTAAMISDVHAGQKRCKDCGLEKSIQDFDWMKTSVGKMTLRTACMVCRNLRSRQWRDANREHVRARGIAWRHRKPDRKEWAKDHNLRHFYGITLAEYQTLLVAQGGRCAICRTDRPGGKHPSFHVDHDHETKKIRGLLCNNCNNGLGRFKDDPLRLRAAVSYLEARRWR